MRRKNLSIFLTALMVMIATFFVMPAQLNATYLLYEEPSCKPVLGGSCQCEAGQECKAGLFKCKCTNPKPDK